MCPCGKAVESKTRTVEECEIHKEERDVFEEEVKKLDECSMEKFGTRYTRQYRENDRYPRK